MLQQHPEVFVSPIKEPLYFVSEADFSFRFPPGEPQIRRDEYLALFRASRPGQCLGEASTMYLRSPVTAQRIAAANPAARIVAILRDPAILVWSFHHQMVRRRYQPIADLRTALAEEGQLPAMLRYSELVRFVDQLRRYHDAFGADQILVLTYDDYRASNNDVVRRIFGHLGVVDDFEIRAVERNQSFAVRSSAALALLGPVSPDDAPTWRAVRRSLRRVTPEAVKRRVVGPLRHRALLTAGPPPMDPALLEELRRRYAPEVTAVSDYLGRDLVAQWGY